MNRGTIVLVDWPFSDRRGSKLRPAVVVQADFLNGMIDDTVPITSQPRIAATEVDLDPAVESKSGLKYPSIASCNNFLTIDQVFVLRVLGSEIAMYTLTVPDGWLLLW
jgi:mRNA interferase MazF